MCHYSPMEVKRQLYRTCFLLLPLHGFWGWNLDFQVNTFTCESSHWPGFPCLSLLSPPLSFPPFSLFFPLLPFPFLFSLPLLPSSPPSLSPFPSLTLFSPPLPVFWLWHYDHQNPELCTWMLSTRSLSQACLSCFLPTVSHQFSSHFSRY